MIFEKKKLCNFWKLCNFSPLPTHRRKSAWERVQFYITCALTILHLITWEGRGGKSQKVITFDCMIKMVQKLKIIFFPALPPENILWLGEYVRFRCWAETWIIGPKWQVLLLGRNMINYAANCRENFLFFFSSSFLSEMIGYDLRYYCIANYTHWKMTSLPALWKKRKWIDGIFLAMRMVQRTLKIKKKLKMILQRIPYRQTQILPQPMYMKKIIF